MAASKKATAKVASPAPGALLAAGPPGGSSATRKFENAVVAGGRRAGLGGKAVLCAVSGGPDSMALLWALARRRDALGLTGLGVAHVDHQLRPESARDGQAVAGLAGRLNLPFAVARLALGSADALPGGVEAAARAARYTALLEMALAGGYAAVVTGHTRTDQAETVVLRLLRGSGLRGLSAMAWNRRLASNAGVRLCRPLLGLSAAETRGYAAAFALPVAVDASNADRRLLRNAVRLDLWPVLVDLAPAAERRLAELAAQSREDEAALDALARAAQATLVEAGPPGAPIAVRARPLAALPPAVGRRLLRRCVARLRPASQPSAVHLRQVLAMCVRGGKGELHLPDGLEAKLSSGRLVLQPRRSPPPARRE